MDTTDLSHLPPGPKELTEFPEPTNPFPRWNYERCSAICGSVIIGKVETETWWSYPLQEQRTPAIKITYGDGTFYIQNEPNAFAKVFCRGGGPWCGSHKSITVDDEDSFVPDPEQPITPPEKISFPNHEKSPDKIPRNHPCPCGSGLKYKKCCLS